MQPIEPEPTKPKRKRIRKNPAAGGGGGGKKKASGASSIANASPIPMVNAQFPMTSHVVCCLMLP
jgi:hypothetical protein